MKANPKAHIFGPCVGELYWEIYRFAGHAIWYKKHYPNIKLLVHTRPDRYDIYGRHADAFLPLVIHNDDIRMRDCFRVSNMGLVEYAKLIDHGYEYFRENYEIVNHYYPDIKTYTARWQFPRDKMLYDFKPRFAIYKAILPYLDGRPVIAITPRYQQQERKRNWFFWEAFYDKILHDGDFDNYQFIICGTAAESVVTVHEDMLNLCDIPTNEDVSLIGLTIAVLQKAVLTVGSQSAIPNLSLLLGTPVLAWGHQKERHAVRLNPFKTPITFIKSNYRTSENIIIEFMKDILAGGDYEFFNATRPSAKGP
jgi:hypothetical protein